MRGVIHARMGSEGIRIKFRTDSDLDRSNTTNITQTIGKLNTTSHNIRFTTISASVITRRRRLQTCCAVVGPSASSCSSRARVFSVWSLSPLTMQKLKERQTAAFPLRPSTTKTPTEALLRLPSRAVSLSPSPCLSSLWVYLCPCRSLLAALEKQRPRKEPRESESEMQALTSA